jgi:hypothetical protein
MQIFKIFEIPVLGWQAGYEALRWLKSKSSNGSILLHPTLTISIHKMIVNQGRTKRKEILTEKLSRGLWIMEKSKFRTNPIFIPSICAVQIFG